MNDSKTYYAAIRQEKERCASKFPTGYGLVIATKPGSHDPVEVDLNNMARLIVEGNFRLVTPAEEKAFRDAQDLQRSHNASIDVLTRARQQFGLTPKGGGK